MKHNEIIDCLELRTLMEHSNLIVNREEEFDIESGHGEIDLYDIDLNYRHANLYEVKQHDEYRTRHKATKQLNKDKQYMFEKFGCTDVDKYYVYYDADHIVIETIDDMFDKDIKPKHFKPEEYEQIFKEYKSEHPRIYGVLKHCIDRLEEYTEEYQLDIVKNQYEAIRDIFSNEITHNVGCCFDCLYDAVMSRKHEGENQK